MNKSLRHIEFVQPIPTHKDIFIIVLSVSIKLSSFFVFFFYFQPTPNHLFLMIWWYFPFLCHAWYNILRLFRWQTSWMKILSMCQCCAVHFPLVAYYFNQKLKSVRWNKRPPRGLHADTAVYIWIQSRSEWTIVCHPFVYTSFHCCCLFCFFLGAVVFFIYSFIFSIHTQCCEIAFFSRTCIQNMEFLASFFFDELVYYYYTRFIILFRWYVSVIWLTWLYYLVHSYVCIESGNEKRERT